MPHNAIAVIDAAYRRAFLGRIGGQIGFGEVAGGCRVLHGFDDVVRDRPAIKGIGALGGDHPQRRGERRVDDQRALRLHRAVGRVVERAGSVVMGEEAVA